MEKSFKDILYEHEREDRAAIVSEEGMMNAVRKEFSNAGQLIFQARQQGFSLFDFFSGSPLPVGMPLPVRRSQTFYIKKHTAVQRPYMHSHEFYELVYVQMGKCLQTLKDGRQTQLKKGQCCLLCPGAAHRIERADRGDVILKAVIPCGLFARATDGILLPDNLLDDETLFIYHRRGVMRCVGPDVLFMRLAKRKQCCSGLPRLCRSLYRFGRARACFCRCQCPLGYGADRSPEYP